MWAWQFNSICSVMYCANPFSLFCSWPLFTFFVLQLSFFVMPKPASECNALHRGGRGGPPVARCMSTPIPRFWWGTSFLTSAPILTLEALSRWECSARADLSRVCSFRANAIHSWRLRGATVSLGWKLGEFCRCTSFCVDNLFVKRFE